jgi:hypothetical protein
MLIARTGRILELQLAKPREVSAWVDEEELLGAEGGKWRSITGGAREEPRRKIIQLNTWRRGERVVVSGRQGLSGRGVRAPEGEPSPPTSQPPPPSSSREVHRSPDAL